MKVHIRTYINGIQSSIIRCDDMEEALVWLEEYDFSRTDEEPYKAQHLWNYPACPEKYTHDFWCYYPPMYEGDEETYEYADICVIPD